MAKRKTIKEESAQGQSDILIANPIYDVVFKNLMTTNKDTNKDNASYFVGAILGEEIADIELLPQEYTYHMKAKKKIKEQTGSENLTVVRLDFLNVSPMTHILSNFPILTEKHT
jgi:hypothetical protein